MSLSVLKILRNLVFFNRTTTTEGAKTGEVSWRLVKLISTLLFMSWLLYFLVFSFHATRPCFGTSDCLSFLVSSSQSIVRFSHEETSLHHLVFGIAASADLWPKRSEYIKLWWQADKTRGYVWLDRALNDSESRSIRKSESSRSSSSISSIPIRVSEDTSKFRFTHPNGPRSAVRVARIILETFRLGLPNVRWFILGDDDTLFFTGNLVKLLQKYDHRQYYYIGCNSESTDQNAYHSYNMAYGGGGFAISYPLAEVLVKILDGCIDRYHNLYGSDQRIQACLSEIGVPMTREPGFHQFDVRGNLFGILAAHPQTQVVSFHHLDSVVPIFPNRTRVEALKHLMQVAEVDSERMLQQSICYDRERKWTFSVSWGYCVQVYERIELPRNLEFPMLTFVTWSQYGRPSFMFNTRPVPRDPCRRPTVFFLHDIAPISAVEESTMSVYTVQVYDPVKNNCSVNAGRELTDITVFSHDGPFNHAQGRRRQCCDVVSRSNNNAELLIRNCGAQESIVPLM